MNNIGGINGYGNYGLGGYVPRRGGNDGPEENAAENVGVNNAADTQVDPAKVMDFLTANNYFVAPANTKSANAVDAATQARVEDYMANFEMIYGIVVEEFGEELAPDVMDVAMDHLMGSVT